MNRQTCSGLLAAAVIVFAQSTHAADYHVSPLGNDANTGLGLEDATALRTIQAAVDKAQPGDTVLVHAGTYRETVTFPRSGTPRKRITVKPYENDTVVVSGCDPITGWERHTDTVWKAPMPWTLGKGRNQVFVNDEVRIEARHPNEPEGDLGMYVSDLSPLWPTFAEFSIPDPTKEPGRIVGKLLEGFPDNHWQGACYYGVHYQGWSAQTGIIEGSKDGEITVGDRTRTWWFGPAYGGRYKPEEGRGMIVGHMNALDQPGEWHWQDDTLYLIPTHGLEPRDGEAKRRQLAFDLSGREHIHISGLNIQAASMRLDGSANCVVDGCTLEYISHFTRFYSIGQIENGRNTIKSGETGIFVGGRDNAFLHCTVRYSAGAGFYLRGYHHTIHNCLIDEIDYCSHYLNAITDAVSDFKDYENFLVGGHVITYNTMRNAGRHFFNFYGNGTSRGSRDRGPMDYMATLFAHNHLYNGMLQTKDAGFLTGYYCSGGTLNGLNSQVVYNVMHDCYDIFGMRINVLGIVYLDAGTCDVDLHHNLLWAAPGSHQLGLWYNTMCVDVHEHDNLFHEKFERTCAQLKKKDFPEGRPFRFGHDFKHQPTLPVWPQLDSHRIEAEACTDRSSGVATSASGISGFQDGDWACLGEVDFDRGWQSMVMSFASDVRELNSDNSARARPRHKKATDPLVLEVISREGAARCVKQQWTFIHNVKDEAWIQFKQISLGEGYRRFRVVYGNDQSTSRQLEVRLDRADGPLVGRVELPRTDKPRGRRIQIYAEAVGEISREASGTHDVFLVFRSDDGGSVGEFEYFRFEQYRTAIPLQKNEVKLELRVDSTTGEKIGEFYPRFTGGPAVFSSMVANLESVQGNRPLYLVVRSALGRPVGMIDWLSLQKAKQPIDWTGVGEAPRKRSFGRMVLPKPTHRPCARPNDKYPKRKRTARKIKLTPRPLFSASRLTAAPTVNADLAEWTSDPMTLTESWDGSKSAGPTSTVWIGYDDEALYIAVKNPVKEAKTLDYESHTWGGTDAMEIAFQDGYAASPGPILNLYGWPDGYFESVEEAGAPAKIAKALGKAVTYKAAIGIDTWICEWRIPFAASGFTPATTPMIRLNIGVRKMAEQAWVIWHGTGAPTYELDNGGTLIFAADSAALRDVPRQNLEVWLDSADAATIEKDTAGKVSLWKDKSGKGRDAAQPLPAHRPTYAAAALNGRPALQFSEETATRLELPDLSSEKMSGTVVAVFSNPEPGSEQNHDPRIFTASDGKEYDYRIGICASVRGMKTGGPRQRTFSFTDRWAKKVRVGCFSPMYQTYFTGHIAEILVYTGNLTPEHRDRIRAYLALKWGLE